MRNHQATNVLRQAALAGLIAGAALLGATGTAQAYVPTIVTKGDLATNPTPAVGGVANAVLSPDGRYGYYSLDSGSSANPARGSSVEKFDLTTLTSVNAVELPSLYQGGFGFAITPDGTAAYGTYGAGRVAKFDLTTTPISFAGGLQLSNTITQPVESAAMAPDGAYLYAVQKEIPATLFKIRLSDFTEVAAVTLPSPTIGGAAVNVSPDGTKIWVVSKNTTSGVQSSTIVEYDSATLTPGRSVTLSTAKHFSEGVVSADGKFGYYESAYNAFSNPAPVFTKVDLTTMTEVGVLSLPSGQSGGALAISPDGASLYAGTGDWPAKLNVIRTSDMTLVDTTTLPTGANGALYGALVSKNGAFVSLATYETPPYEVVKIQVRPLYALTVAKAGKGTGTVTSNPTGIECGAVCTFDYLDATAVTLTAAAAEGSTFRGWSGACSGATVTCTVTMAKAETATATFDKVVTKTKADPLKVVRVVSTGRRQAVQLSVPGSGKVSLSGTRKVGGRTIKACASVSRKVTEARTIVLTCKVSAETQAARRAGPVRIRLVSTYKPSSGKQQTIVRYVTLSAIGPAPPVTG